MGQTPHRATILSVSLSYPCVVTTTEAHGFSTGHFIRLTNLNGAMPAPQHGMDQLDGHRYRIVVLETDTFKIQNPITNEDIDSTGFTPYTDGGNVNLIAENFIYNAED